MAYKVECELSKLKNMINALERYISDVEKENKNMNREMKNASSYWKGPDASAFMIKWGTMNASLSGPNSLLHQLKSYKKYLEDVYNSYLIIQANAESWIR